MAGLSYTAGLYRGAAGLWSGAAGLWSGAAGLQAGWSPAALFAASEQGVWFDPSDLTTLFQDSAGTTPVTAAGQVVGLVLDKSKGLVLGAELVANGNFNGSTGWTLGSGHTISNNQLNIAAAVTTTSSGSTVGGLFTPGGTYRITYKVSNYTKGSVRVVVGASGGVIRTSNGTFTEYLLATTPSGNIIVQNIGDTSLTIDIISARELPGNHATQSVLASRPLYQTVPDRLTLDKIDDRLLMTVPTGGFVGTMVLATPQGTAAYGVNIPAGSYAVGGTTTGAYFPGTAMQGYVIRNGALTQSQIDQTITYLRAAGGGLDYGSVTNFTTFWRNRSEITSFPLINTAAGTNFTSAWFGCSALTSFPLINTAAGTNFFQAWRDCISLTSFPLINTAAGTNFYQAWFGCSSLTSFPANFFNGCAATNFTNAFATTALNQASIDGILVSINSNGTSNGTFNQSGGSAPSATGQAAIDALRARGWTVTVTGGY